MMLMCTAIVREVVVNSNPNPWPFALIMLARLVACGIDRQVTPLCLAGAAPSRGFVLAKLDNRCVTLHD